MNITEANAVNTMIEWILTGKRGHLNEPIDDNEALEAALRLTLNANKALSAGLAPADVKAQWPKRRFKTPPVAKERVGIPLKLTRAMVVDIVANGFAEPTCVVCKCTTLAPCPEGCGWEKLHVQINAGVCTACLLKYPEQANRALALLFKPRRKKPGRSAEARA